MTATPVFNITSPLREFTIAGYRFVRVPEYEDAIQRLPVKGQVTLDFATGRLVETVRERPGVSTQTYEASWEGDGPEPTAVIHHDDSTLLDDIALLWSFYGGEAASATDFSLYEGATYAGQSLVPQPGRLPGVIEAALGALTAMAVRDLGLMPGLFLLRESYRTLIANYQALFVAPLVDLLSSKVTVATWSGEAETRLETASAAAAAALEAARVAVDGEPDPLTRNVIDPALGALSRLGSPAALDKLIAFALSSPALRDVTVPSRVLESHLRAFNQLRNATVHYAGLPRDLRVEFADGRKVRVRRKADREFMVQALIHFTQMMRDFVVLHFVRVLGVPLPSAETELTRTLQRFFSLGDYNGARWLDEDLGDLVLPLVDGAEAS